MLCHFYGASTWQASDHEDLVYSYFTHFKNQGKVLNEENWLLLKEFYDNHQNLPVHGINIKNLDC